MLLGFTTKKIITPIKTETKNDSIFSTIIEFMYSFKNIIKENNLFILNLKKKKLRKEYAFPYHYNKFTGKFVTHVRRLELY
jgi:hypothetical protein